VVGQDDFNSVDLNQIKQRKIKKLIRQLQSSEYKGFSDLEVSVNSESSMDEYKHYTKEYLVKQDVEEVWYNYVFSSQTEVWDISKISFGMIYCRDSKSIIYADQMLKGLEKGRIYYLNLKILGGIYNLPVAFEITNFDPINKTVEFSYLKGGKARGKQWIRLEETEQGNTKIVHQTLVKSDSNFRDKYLYPYFHNKLINEFHMNMKRIIAARSKRRIDMLVYENGPKTTPGPSD
jgi:hypothetical protein